MKLSHQDKHILNELIMEGLGVEEKEHKQWYLERLAAYIGIDTRQNVYNYKGEEYGLADPGITPPFLPFEGEIIEES